MKKFILLLLFSLSLFANPELIVKNLSPFVQDIDKDNIYKTEIDGIYEVLTTNPIDSIFVSNDGRFILRSEAIIDLKNRKTMDKNPKIKELFKDALADVADEDKVIFKAKDEKYSVHIFTDVDCPFCQRLHRQMPEINKLGITVKYLASPIASIHPRAQETMEKIWCSKDRQAAMNDYKLDKKMPRVESCDNPVAEQIALSQRMGINGTPSIFLEDGTKIGGYIPAKELLERIKASKK